MHQQLAVPAAAGADLLDQFFGRPRLCGHDQVARVPADRLLRPPAIEGLRAAVPADDIARDVRDDDRRVDLIQQHGLQVLVSATHRSVSDHGARYLSSGRR